MADQNDMLKTAEQTQLGNYRPGPFVLVEGKGCRVRDAAGKSYLDLSGGISVLSVGHSHPTLVKAIADQAGRLMHVSNIFYNERAIELSAELVARTAYDRVYFCNSGSEANETLLKLARRYHFEQGDKKRTGIVATWNGFHGRTMGALSMTGRKLYHQGMAPMVEGVSFVDFNDVEALEKAVDETTAAVIFEPIQAEGGIHPASLEFMQGARKICDDSGALLLFDEIQTGYARTGRFLAQEHFGVVADACSLAKGMGGGFPLGGVILRESLANGLPPGSHGSTFGGNALACAAGLAVLEVIDEEKLIENAEETGEHLRAALHSINDDCDATTGVRGMGLLAGLALADDVDPGAALNAVQQASVLMTLAGRNVMRVSPALNVTRDEIDEGLSVLSNVLRDPPKRKE